MPIIPNMTTAQYAAHAPRRNTTALIQFAGVAVVALALVTGLGGCVSVTNRSTNSARTGTEQLLMTGATDRAIDSIDFTPLAGQTVFLTPPTAATDADWINFSLRRAMSRQGVLLADKKDDAQTIVEAAIGAYGTDEAERRISLPSGFSMGMGMIPLPMSSNDSGFYRRQRQNSVTKLALFAYDASSRLLVWDSNTIIGQGDLDRRFLGNSNISRKTTEPELATYPPREVLR